MSLKLHDLMTGAPDDVSEFSHHPGRPAYGNGVVDVWREDRQDAQH